MLSRLFVLGFLVELVCGLDVTCVGCESVDWIGLDCGYSGEGLFVAVIYLSLFLSLSSYLRRSTPWSTP